MSNEIKTAVQWGECPRCDSTRGVECEESTPRGDHYCRCAMCGFGFTLSEDGHYSDMLFLDAAYDAEELTLREYERKVQEIEARPYFVIEWDGMLEDG